MLYPPAPKKTRGRPRLASAAKPAATVQSLERALDLLGAVASAERITLSELAQQTGIAPSTAHRLLGTMLQRGIVAFDEASQNWMVGVEAFRIGNSFVRRTDLIETGRRELLSLVRITGETANMAVADDGDVVFVSQVESHHLIRAFFRPGTRGNMHASGIGKALLAEYSRRGVEKVLGRKGLAEFTAKTITTRAALLDDLEAIRARGWALDDEERTLGMRCLAAAIFNEYGEAVAGISVSGPTVRLRDERLDQIGHEVARAAMRVTTAIGGRKPGDARA
ncbi:MAG: HTH-type transcriptional regulator BhcR [Paracoccaceae bacterium]